MISRSVASCFALMIFVGLTVAAQESAYTPERGDPERQEIVDALRVPVQKRLKKDVIFKIDHLKVKDGWAFMRGVPQQPGGVAMDYRGTIYAQAQKDGVFDDWICALLRKRNGKWEVVRFVIGATDVAWEGWDRQYRAPKAIFG